MRSKEQQLADNLIEFVNKQCAATDPGHDISHSIRVLNNALLIMADNKCDREVVIAASILHDLADHKFGDENKGLANIRSKLTECGFKQQQISNVAEIVSRMSFSKESRGVASVNIAEFNIVQDADRLDAIGAIGVARAFSYGGFRQRPLYSTDDNSTIAHFHHKLLKLRDMMKTEQGRIIANERHEFLVLFLEQFARDCHQ